MCKPDKKPKVYKEARCTGRGSGETHVMVLASLSRSWGCDGSCGGGRSNWPRDVLYYTCEPCNMDFCPNCFHKVEKTIVEIKTTFEEDPDVFKVAQVVYSKTQNTYVKIKTANHDEDMYTCYDTQLDKEGKAKTEVLTFKSSELTKFIIVSIKVISNNSEKSDISTLKVSINEKLSKLVNLIDGGGNLLFKGKIIEKPDEFTFL